MKDPRFSLLFILIGIFLLTYTSCVHEPVLPTIIPSDTNTIDTSMVDTSAIDTSQVDTTAIKPCDPDTVYFSRDVLPILISNCAQSGCHDDITMRKGFSLTNYDNVIDSDEVDPFDLDGSDLYEVLVETDPDKVMPPSGPLEQSQIDVIAKWITQGAQDLTCQDDTSTGCDTANVSFSATVFPILDLYCVGCHSGGNPRGGIDLSNYNEVKIYAENGSLYGSVAHLSGYSEMPKGGDKLPDCEIDQIEAWINQGVKDN